ncbi:PAN2-PAN3 deadenylation complex subunit pan3 [Bagarius yarrelli]|uniref:PAN2-PAN3 deadenylation complex subunit pan3 n=1 Tax=Bagarius yarrelli TaxID=175774 RepID=A0A556TWK9_BAGYA|nr:PAN2-PAN3 deadenylation complex subunit pan3 [Bagarius yarrelli]
MNSGLPVSAAPLGGVGIPGVKVKFCRYYAKDKTCFYGDDCQFLHEDPSAANAVHGGGGSSSSPVTLALAGGAVSSAAVAVPGYPLPGNVVASCSSGAAAGIGKKSDALGPAGATLDGQLLSITAMDGGALSDANLTNSYFSSSFIGVNGFGSPAESKYSMMQRMTSSSSSPSLLNDGAKNFSHGAQDPVNSPTSSLFSDFGGLSISQRRKAPNPAATEFIPKGAPRMSTMSQAAVPTFPSPLFPHPGLSGSAAAGLSPGMSLSAGSSPLHSPKITPHTSPAPRRRSHTPNPNPANYMVPTTASEQAGAAHIIQKETVGGTTYFYTDNTPAPMAGMVFPTYHIYPQTAPHVAYMQPKANAPSFFMADELRQELITRHLITMAQIDQSETGVPSEVDSYHSLFPLEPLLPPNRLQKTSNFSYITTCYKAVNSKDDLPYCLRRIHALVFSYDFHAGAETMYSRHFNDPTADSYFTKRKWGPHEPPPPRQHAGLLPESLIWAYIVQLSSALRTIHTAGLACRVMDPSKILITGKTRLRVNCVGVFDVLTFDNNQTNHLALMPQYQEVQNGRLFRLLAKLGTINERPEFQKDPTWSETGDRYLLKLFRDHLFHQVTEAGTPWVDLSHIVSCLNKLDAGVPEKISLVSRDEKSVLVVTYSDLKRCFDSTFQELLAAANGSL